MSWYCDIAPGHPWHGPYHDEEYGFPLHDDVPLFERLCLEIFQAGLSWLIVLKKREHLRQAFDGFDPRKIAAYGDEDIARLLADEGIIRNRRKILAVIENARRLLVLQAENGSFDAWLDRQAVTREGTAATKEDWVKLFKRSFVFTGGEVVGEFLMSIGRLPGAHRADCPAQRRIDGLSAERPDD